MTKEKKPLFEKMEFDDVAYAKSVVDECNVSLQRNKIGLIVGIAVPIFDFILLAIVSLLLDKGIDLVGVGFVVMIIAAIVAYVIGGGLITSLKMIWKITWFSFLIIPIFPIDIVVGIIAGAFVVFGAIFLPVIVIFFERLQIKSDLEAANDYLKYCKPVES